MLCTNCGEKLLENAKFCHVCGTKTPTNTTLQVEQKIGTVAGEVVGTILSTEATQSGIDSSTKQTIDSVERGGNVVGTIVGSKDTPIHVGGKQHYGDKITGVKIAGDKFTGDKVAGDKIAGNKQIVHTSGGDYIRGNVSTSSGDFVGRDKVSVGNIAGSSNIAIGKDIVQTIRTQGVTNSELTRLFAILQQQITQRPEDPLVDKEELQSTVKRIEKETAQGELANPDKVHRWLKMLADAAPGVVQAVVKILMNPSAGVAGAVQQVAWRFLE